MGNRKRHHLKGGYDSSWIRPTTRLALYLRDGLCCIYCLQDWSVGGLTIDHVVSRSDGGTNDHTNLVSACARCNGLKRAAGTWENFAQCLGINVNKLMIRLAQQAQPLTRHLKNRANSLVKTPPPWLIELRELNKRWSPQVPLLINGVLLAQTPVEEPSVHDSFVPLGDDEVPF